jgi:hypothetical protein
MSRTNGLRLEFVELISCFPISLLCSGTRTKHYHSDRSSFRALTYSKSCNANSPQQPRTMSEKVTPDFFPSLFQSLCEHCPQYVSTIFPYNSNMDSTMQKSHEEVRKAQEKLKHILEQYAPPVHNSGHHANRAENAQCALS